MRTRTSAYNYTITYDLPSGVTHRITAPEDASLKEVRQHADEEVARYPHRYQDARYVIIHHESNGPRFVEEGTLTNGVHAPDADPPILRS